MNIQFKFTICLLALSALNLVGINQANAQVNSAPLTSEQIAQATNQPTTKRKPKATFGEEDRRPRFGFGDFVDSALDGADNFFSPDPVRGSPGVISEPLSTVRVTDIPGVLTVGIDSDQKVSNDPNRPAFLEGNFISPDNNTRLYFQNARQSDTPQRGTVNLRPDSVINGAPVNGLLRQYNGSGMQNGDTFTGAVQLVDPNNPGNSILIEVPPTRNLGDDNTGRGPARLSIGRPVDR